MDINNIEKSKELIDNYLRLKEIEERLSDGGDQPLSKIKVASIPNGILLTSNPNYLSKYPHLFFPGKDDSKKGLRKLRARVSFDILEEIDSWRVTQIQV